MVVTGVDRQVLVFGPDRGQVDRLRNLLGAADLPHDPVLAHSPEGLDLAAVGLILWDFRGHLAELPDTLPGWLKPLHSSTPLVLWLAAGESVPAKRLKSLGVKALWHGPVEDQEVLSRLQDLLRENRKKPKKALNDQEILHQSPDPLLFLDTDGVVQSFNRAAEVMTGYPASQVIGKPFYTLPFLPRPAQVLVRREFQRVLKGHEPRTREFPLVQDTRREVILEANPHAVKSNGEIVGMDVTFRDITQRRQAERVNRCLLNLARSANQVDDLESYYQETAKELMGLYGEVEVLVLFPTLSNEEASAWSSHGENSEIRDEALALAEDLWRDKASVIYKPPPEDGGEGQQQGPLMAAAIPLAEGEIGALVLQGSLEGARYSQKDLSVMEQVARGLGLVKERFINLAALKTSEDLYRDLIEHSDSLICIHDIEGKILNINRYAYEILNYDNEQELLGRNIAELIPAKLRKEYLDYLKIICDHGQARGILRLLTKDGGYRLLEFSNTLRERPGEEPLIRAIGRDITEQFKMQKVLKEREEQLEDLFRNARDFIFILHPDGSLKRGNLAWLERMGYTEGEAKGLTVFDLVHADSWKAWSHAFQQSRHSRTGEQVEVILVSSAGEQIVAEGSLRGRFKDDNLAEIWGIFRDITARKHSEEELRRRALIFATITDGVMIWNEKGHVMEWNPACERLLGFTQAEAEGKSLGFWLAPEASPGSLDGLQKSLLKQERWAGEVALERKSGEVGVFHTIVVPLREGGGNEGRFVAVLQDITERKAAETALKEAHDELEGRVTHRTRELAQANEALRLDIQARMEAEAEVRKLEGDYRTLFERANDAILIMEPHGEMVLDCNERACAMYGLKREKFLGKSMKTFTQDVGRGEAFVKEMLEKGSVTGFESVHFRSDGTPMILWISGSTIKFKGKDAVLSIIRDISERKKMEVELSESLAKYLGILQNIDEGYLEIDPHLHITFFNPSFCHILGASEPDISGKPLKNFTAPDSLPVLEQACNRLFAGKIGRELVKWEVITQTGHSTLLEATLTPIYGEEGRTIGLRAMVRDMTDRLRAEEDLRRSERRFRDLFETVDMGICLVQPDGLVVGMNPAARRMFKVHTEDSVLYSLEDFFDPKEVESLREAMLEHLWLGKEQSDMLMDTKEIDGEIRRMGVGISVGTMDPTELPIFQLRLRDVTEKERARKRLEESEKMAGYGRLVAGVAHEVRNPIFAIEAAGYNINTMLSGKDEVSEQVGIIEKEARRMRTLMEELLSFARPKPLKKQPLVVQPLLEEAFSVYQIENPVPLPKVELLLPRQPLPDVLGDRDRVIQVLVNLMENARKHGQGATKITLTATLDTDTREGRRIAFKVADNGCGVPEENRERIFDPFFTTIRKSTGLGLSIVKRIVADHGGELQLEDTPGGGATFVCLLPLQEDPEQEQEEVPAPQEKPHGAP